MREYRLGWNFFRPMSGFYLLAIAIMCPVTAQAQQLLQVLEPGIGFARFKQWAIENKLVFENFTKDSLIVRDTGLMHWESIRIQARFCAGDDYSGKASSIVIQQLFKPKIDAVVTQRDYVEFLAGKPSEEGRFSGNYTARRDRKDGNGDGIAIGHDEGDKGFWEVGLFRRAGSGDRDEGFAMVQTVRRKDSICR
jgi:hypothetical protein